MKKIKVALVNPPVLGILEPWYDEPDFVRTALAFLASYLKEKFNPDEIEIKIIDAKFEKLNFLDVIAQLSLFMPDILGLTAFTNEIKPAAYLAAKYKIVDFKCITVIGGVHVTAIPNETLIEFPSFDIGVIGEGEETLYELARNVLTNNNFEDVKGIIYRQENGSLILNPPRPRNLDYESFPLPAWDLMPKAKTYFVQSVKGCPLNCSFCMNPNGKSPRARTVDTVMKELNWLIQNFKPERISFGDEIFSVDLDRTKSLLDEFIKTGFGKKVKWDVQTHVRYVDKELFKKFKLANVERVELGIESGDDEILKKMGKGTNIELIMNAVKWAKSENVKIGTFFLIGQPNETMQSLQKTLNLAIKINPHIPMFGIMTPYPGTEIARMAARGEGGYKILTMDWDEYNKQIGGAISFANLTRSQIERFQLKAYLLIYLLNFRVFDFISFCFEYKFLAFKILKKLILKQDKIGDFYNKPPDYDLITKSSLMNPTIYVSSREEWKKTQNIELIRTKEVNKR